MSDGVAPASVRVTVTVAVPPVEAFRVFTGDFGEWYRSGSAALGRRGGISGVLAFEPGPSGRLVELRDGDEPAVLADVVVWDPGARLVFVDRRRTEVDVSFVAVPEGTRVVLEHRGLDRLPPGEATDIVRCGWRRLADWFEFHLETRSTP
ncbi:MAG: hypothetical protein AAFZ07_24780 [Actinomycetota bacterium]